jgi:hypothetical protein
VICVVQTQDADEESTTVELSSTTVGTENQSNKPDTSDLTNQTKVCIGNKTDEEMSNSFEWNNSSSLRIIIALAVLCVAFAVLLGLFVMIVFCRWLQNVEEQSSSSHDRHLSSNDHLYQTTVKL